MSKEIVAKDTFASNLQPNTNECSHSSEERSDNSGSTVSPRKDGAWIRLCEVIDKRFISGMTPAYYVSVMGTGISAAILYNFPYFGQWLRVCSYIMWGVAIIFFFFLSFWFVVSVIKIRNKWVVFHRDFAVAPFMGTVSMGYNTLVNMLHNVTGDTWPIGVYVFWWIGVFSSLYTACIVFYCALVSKNKNASTLPTTNLHATILLPIVTLTVSASSGCLVGPTLNNHNLEILTMIICYIMWAIAISLAIVIITVHYWKLFVHKIPNTALVFTSFLPVGVLGQGAYGIMLLGVNIHSFIASNPEFVANPHHLSYIAESDLPSNKAVISLIVGNIFVYMCAMISLFLISFGYFSTFIAVISCLSKIKPFTKRPNIQHTYTRQSSHIIKDRFIGLIKFSKAYWAMTFPLGTMALANTELYHVFNNLEAFRVVGTMYAVSLLLIVLGCLIGCIYTIYCEANYILCGPKPQLNEVERKV